MLYSIPYRVMVSPNILDFCKSTHSVQRIHQLHESMEGLHDLERLTALKTTAGLRKHPSV